MFLSIHLLLVCLSVYVAANRVNPPSKVIKLTLAVSKAAYIPFSERRFIRNGYIIENPSTSKLRKLWGFIPLPPKYNPAQDKIACAVGGWIAKSYENKETEVLMFKNVEQKLVVFGFRGTEPTSLKDWSKNLKIFPGKSTIGQTTFTTHKGFRDRYGFIADWFEREYLNVPRDYSIVITGHSLGAAEATIAAVYAAGKLERRPDAVITYGSPISGAQDFKNYYNQVVGCDRTIRMAAKGDLVTIVPAIFGYLHVCDATKVDSTRPDGVGAHSLYGGYEYGIKSKFGTIEDINFGCDKLLS